MISSARQVTSLINCQLAIMRKDLVTWEHAKEIFVQNVGFLEENSGKNLLLRQQMLCVDRDSDVNFDDFIFLRFGPLEHGVFYNAISNYKNVTWNPQNTARQLKRGECLKAIERIVKFPEFEKWQGRTCTSGFSLGVLGRDYEKRNLGTYRL